MKHLWTPKDGPVPKRGGKKHLDPLDKVADWMTFKAAIFSGKMKPQEQIGFKITPDIKTSTGIDQPWRVARDRLRRQLKEAGLLGDFHVQMYQPEPESNPDYRFLLVTYEPPMLAGKKRA